MNSPTPTPTFHRQLQVRLIALASVKGISLSALSTQMGRAPSHLIRKLAPSEGSGDRALTTEDIDEILTALGETPAVLQDHVMGPGDRAILTWIVSCEVPPSEGERFFKAQQKAMKRLAIQGLVLSTDGSLTLTDEGRRMSALAAERS